MAQAAIQGGNPVEDVHTRTTASGPQSQAVVVGIDGSDAVVPASTAGLRVDTSGGALLSGRTTIATAGTPAVVNASTPCKSLFITALPTNTLQIAIGPSGANADNANLQGIPLQPGQGIGLDVAHTNLVYFDVLGDGHGITWVAIQ